LNSDRKNPQPLKLSIDYKSMVERFYDEAKLLGLVAPIEPYQFCWKVNDLLHFDFRTRHDLQIQKHNKGRNYFFPIYQYKIPQTSIGHYIYVNHDDGEYLLPELKHFDYLWLMKFDEVDEDEIELFTKTIKTIPVLQMVTELAIDKIKKKEDLFF